MLSGLDCAWKTSLIRVPLWSSLAGTFRPVPSVLSCLFWQLHCLVFSANLRRIHVCIRPHHIRAPNVKEFMKRIQLQLFLTFLLTTFACAQAPFTTRAGVESGASYDILGLKLGMTAAEAEKVLYPLTHTLPPPPTGTEWKLGGYLVDSHAPKIGGEGYPVSLIAYRDLKLFLTFVEVPRGEAKGSEMLWQITYKPELRTPDPLKPTKEAVAALQQRLTQKFGQPYFIYSDAVWSREQLKTEYLYKKSGLTYLILETSGDLTLANPVLESHMREVFSSRKPVPPL